METGKLPKTLLYNYGYWEMLWLCRQRET